MGRPGVNSSLPSDEALIERYTRGDETAFHDLYARYQERAVMYAWRMLRRREVAEEVCAEVFVQIAQGAWSPTGTFRAFLFTLIRNRCLDRLRRNQRWQRLLPGLHNLFERAHQTPEQAIADDQRRFLLESALATLSEAHRTIVLLFYGEELTSREIAAVMGCSDQQVRSKLSYARQKLRGLLSDMEV